jgi:hypothetical protein
MNSKVSFQTLNRHQLVDDVVFQLHEKFSAAIFKPAIKFLRSLSL